MSAISKRSAGLSRPLYQASQVLDDYAHWMRGKFGKAADTYLTNARTFLKTYKGGSITHQILDHGEDKSPTLRSFLKRFADFLQKRQIDAVINDLEQKKLTQSNAYVMLFLLHSQDRLRGDLSSATYATVLNHYFATIRENPRYINKLTAETFLFSRDLSDYTRRLYKAVLKAFCEWASVYQEIPSRELSTDQKKLKKGLQLISRQSLREIIAIKVPTSRSQLKGYHKESLSREQRSRLLSLCKTQEHRAIISLMAWNGLRAIEITRLSVTSCHVKDSTIEVSGKGRSSNSSDLIRLFKTPKSEIARYLSASGLKRGKLFPQMTKKKIDEMIYGYFKMMRLRNKGLKYSPHSLRHTAGQIMYDKDIKLEFIQKTLRHAAMETTLVYAQRGIDRNYLKKMPANT